MVSASRKLSGNIIPGFVVFNKANCRSLINGVSEEFPGVSYRTCPKGWMDSHGMLGMFGEKLLIRCHCMGWRKVIFVDKIGSHNMTTNLSEAQDEMKH